MRERGGNLGLRVFGVAAASTSIGVLLAEFYQEGSMRPLAQVVLIPAWLALAGAGLIARLENGDFTGRLIAGARAGFWATAAYDLWRAPVVLLAIDPFKAHAMFGELATGWPPEEVGTRVIGWIYHLCNGVGFAIMYAMSVKRPGIGSAVIWALLLETAMMMTPYREMVGIRGTGLFLLISGTGHVVFGAVLGYTMSRYWPDSASSMSIS